jgi:hypothetical protein
MENLSSNDGVCAALQLEFPGCFDLSRSYLARTSDSGSGAVQAGLV